MFFKFFIYYMVILHDFIIKRISDLIGWLIDFIYYIVEGY